MRARQVDTAAAPAARTPSHALEMALVDAAERVLVRDGPDAVTVRAVATEAGVAPMGVYNRFGGKDGLVDELLIRGFVGLCDAIGARGETDPIERLCQSGRRYRRFALEHPAHYVAMFDDAIHQDETSEAVHQHAGTAFGALVGHVEYAIAMGVIAPSDPAEIAQQIWSTVHGAVQLEIKGMIQVPDADAAYERLLETLALGLTARGKPRT